MAKKDKEEKDGSNPNIVVGVSRVIIHNARNLRNQAKRKLKGEWDK